MGLYTGMLFLDGHIAQPELARSLAAEAHASPSVTSREAGRRSSGQPGHPEVCRRGALASVCGATTLSPFR